MMKVIKGLAFTAVLAVSLMATSGSAAAKAPRTALSTTPIVLTTGVTWEGSGFGALGVTWE